MRLISISSWCCSFVFFEFSWYCAPVSNVDHCALRVETTFRSLELVCDLIKFLACKEKLCGVLLLGTVYYPIEGGLNIWVCGWNSEVQPWKWKVLSSTLMWWKLVLAFMSVAETLVCDYSNALSVFRVLSSTFTGGAIEEYFMWCCLLCLAALFWHSIL